MWSFLATNILRKRFQILIILSVLTLVMGFYATKVQLSYEFAKVLPNTDSSLIAYEKFKKTFGEDGAVMVVGFKNDNLFSKEVFNGWFDLTNQIKNIEGINDVLSITSLYNFNRNDSLNKFDFYKVTTQRLENEQELLNVEAEINNLPFYQGLIYDKESKATLMAITFDKHNLNSKNRIEIVQKIKSAAQEFQQNNKVELHYSGMPYIRTEFMNKVANEMKLFFALAILVTGLILFIFFRSFKSIVLSLSVVAVGVVWALATMTFFGYKISILSGLLPSLIMIIGIPNCVFLINKYHSEFLVHGNKMKALTRAIEKVGVSLFLANLTTAIGFGVFYYTKSQLLVEFGVVAAINVMITFFITLMLIPIILSFLTAPSIKDLQHLEAKRLNNFLSWIDKVTQHHRKLIYGIIGASILVFSYGIYKINIIGYVVDDLPKKHSIYKDLRFFETNFKGVLPFEIEIDTKKPNGIFAENAKTIYKIKALQKALSEYPELSKPLSVVEGIKFSYQVFKGGNPKFYIVPGASELKKLSEFTTTTQGHQNKLNNFIDSSKSKTRISIQMADVGSIRAKELINEIKPKIDSIFNPKEYNVSLTGHSLVFLKNNDYLLKNLFESLLIEIILITIVGMFLFRSIRIILLSKLPCLIPLIITAGIMGFGDINFKPSTILIFTIAFGISSDGTIYFLTKYRQELKNGFSISEAVSRTIKETGVSIIYTSLILFAGFGVFAASSFGGTVALGLLVSITLLVSMCTNLLLLPSILLSIEHYVSRKEILEEPIIDIDMEEDGSLSNNQE